MLLAFNYFVYTLNFLVQTDPNWSNFLYDEATRTMNLIDFGAARDFPKGFVDDYLRMVSNICLACDIFMQECLEQTFVSAA